MAFAEPDPDATDELMLDLDALAPVARRAIQFRGKRYIVVSILDLPIGAWLELVRLDDGLAALTDTKEIIGRVRRKLAILVPALSDDAVASMSYHQALRATAHAWKVAQGPQKAAAAPASSSGSAASAGSGAGSPSN